MDRTNYSTSMYSGKTEKETYSASTTSSVSGSYYDHIKEEASIWLDKLIQQQEQTGQIVIADYGTADGIGFLSMINSLLEKHLRRMSNFDVMIYLNDQPTNDYNLLIKGITGPATSNLKSGSVLAENVSIAAIGRSMYERCLPKNSLDICFSTTAVHWLSQKPCDISNGITYIHANKVEANAFKEQSKQDWHQFLVNRGKELKKGGMCVILCLSYLPEDDDETNFHVPFTHIGKRLLDSGRITKEEFINTTLQVNMRRPEDLTYPFDHEDKEIVSLGLRLLCSKRIIHKFTGMMKYYSETDEEQAKKYADAVVGFIRPFLRNTVMGGLSSERSEDSRNEICDAFFHIMWEMAFRKEMKVCRLPFQQIVVQKK